MVMSIAIISQPMSAAYKYTDLPLKPNQTDFSRMELFFEFKFDVNADPFIDSESHIPNDHFERDTEAARLLRGQLSSYVAALSGSQFRVHVFTILIFGRRAPYVLGSERRCCLSRFRLYQTFNYLVYSYNTSIKMSTDVDMILVSPFPVRGNLGRCLKSDQTDLQMRNERHRDFRVMLIPDRDDASEQELKISHILSPEVHQLALHLEGQPGRWSRTTCRSLALCS
jgi:hypothetical protein